MPSTVAVNPPETAVHTSSSGSVKTQIDVCKTPSPGGPIPVPYPNLASAAQIQGGSKGVKFDGGSVLLKGSCLSPSSGDEAGSIGGVISGKIKGQSDPMLYSFDVKVEGQNVVRRSDLMMHNKKNSF